jgi:photosystem II stability/assembly factor-like uncharacterized protein/energy-coupling factor transporter ATP-binding protein EcfA2
MSEYDVFLSHNSADKPAVEELARRLVKAGVQPWLDRWNLIPGEPWQEAIEEALERCATCAVFVGPSGTGPWQNEEMRAAIDRRVRESEGRFRVIPVLLPGAERGERSRLPTFLVATTWVEFRRSLDDEDAFHRLVSGVRGVEPGPGPGQAIYEGECPYRGLQFFDVEHAPFFFGREALTEWLLEELHSDNHFLAIIGPSGSGKSSLARAGLVAALEQGEIEGSSKWPIVILRPGPDPLESLAIALSSYTSDVLALVDQLGRDERRLHITTRVALRDVSPERRLVVLVDQFEEVFTLCHDEKLRQDLINNLLYASGVAGGQTLVLLTMRADFYSKCAAYPALAAALSDHQLLVGPMTEDELRSAIERPAQLAGCEFEPGLVDTLLRDVLDQPGGLPLLQHALLELWEGRQGRRLTFAAYREIGGVGGAIAHRADSIYAGFDVAQRAITRRVMLRLTQPGEGTEDTRRRAPLAELLPAEGGAAEVEKVIGELADARLLTTSKDERGDETVDVAHEALIQSWPRLRSWIDEDRAILRTHRRLAEAAMEWVRHDQDESYLYRGARLAQVEKIKGDIAFSALESEFFQASIDARQAERRARRRRRALQMVAVGLALLLLISLGFVVRQIRRSQSLWQPVTGFPDDPVLALAVTDEVSPTYYAATADIGVGRSRDGVTWTLHRTGLPTAEEPASGIEGRDVRNVGRLAVDVLDPQRVFAFVEEYGIYRSEDGGETWQPANTGLPDAFANRLAARGNLVLAVFDRFAGRSLYASLDSGASWELIGGQGEAPLDKVYSVYIAPGGDQVYVGAEGGLYSSATGPPWTWEQILELGPVNIITPEAAGGGFYLVTYNTQQDQGGIYRWSPGEEAQQLTTLDGLPIRLAPHPDPTASIAAYVLLFNGQVLAVTHGGRIESLDQRPGLTHDMLAVAGPTGKDTRLVLGHQDGLLEYQGVPDVTQR